MTARNLNTAAPPTAEADPMPGLWTLCHKAALQRGSVSYLIHLLLIAIVQRLFYLPLIGSRVATSFLILFMLTFLFLMQITWEAATVTLMCLR